VNLSLPWWRTPRRAADRTLSLHAQTAAAAEEPADDMAAAPTVRVHGLSLAYGRTPVLQNLDWRLQPGQVVGLLGRNGAGKTSLLECLLGLRDAQAGEVQLFGQSSMTLDDSARARIGYVPQQSDLFEDLTASQLLAYFRSFYPRWNTGKVDSLLSRWEVPTGTPIGRLSGGQQQRLSIIRALAHDPDLLVLDEPVASLDPLVRRDFLRELVGQVLDRGTTVVFSTHILSDLERVAFNVAFLQAGRIALQAPLDALLEEVVLATGSESALAAFAAASAPAQVLSRQAGRWLLRGADRSAAPAGVLVQPAGLEDLFEALT
jgi:ABC-2 type transport system ATP-binding protein